MAKIRYGKYGMTVTRCKNILGTATICDGQFKDTSGEIISVRDNHMKYLTIQVPSEFKNRVYILNLLHSQCKDIGWS